MGVSARAILKALLAGETEPEMLANLAQGRLREIREALIEARSGSGLAAHQRFMLNQLLGHIEYLEETIERLNEEVAARLDPFEEAIARLATIPGVNRRVGEIILAEIGPDMSKFADSKHLASWLGLCPGNRESAGKRQSGRMRKGNKAARQALMEAAQAAMHTKQTFLSELGQRIRDRRGMRVAVGAVAHRIVVIIYEVLSRGESYRKLLEENRQKQHKASESAEARLIRKLERSGYEVKKAMAVS